MSHFGTGGRRDGLLTVLVLLLPWVVVVLVLLLVLLVLLFVLVVLVMTMPSIKAVKVGRSVPVVGVVVAEEALGGGQYVDSHLTLIILGDLRWLCPMHLCVECDGLVLWLTSYCAGRRHAMQFEREAWNIPVYCCNVE